MSTSHLLVGHHAYPGSYLEPQLSRRKWLCLDCEIDTGKAFEHYFLKDEVWFQIHNSKTGMLCVLCAEQRLGRILVPEDFVQVTINNPKICAMSDRLRARITGNG